MALIFLLKLLFLNFLHSLVIGSLAAVVLLPWSKGLMSPHFEDRKRAEIFIKLVNFLMLPLMVLLPYIAVHATKMSLADKPDRSEWIWWICALIGGIIPMALATGRGEDDPEIARNNSWGRWACRIAFVLAVLCPPLEWHWLLKITRETAMVSAKKPEKSKAKSVKQTVQTMPEIELEKPQSIDEIQAAEDIRAAEERFMKAKTLIDRDAALEELDAIRTKWQRILDYRKLTGEK